MRTSSAFGSASTIVLPQAGAGRLAHVHPQEVVAELLGAGEQFGDGAVTVRSRRPAVIGTSVTLGRRGRGGLDHADDVRVVLLAEVDRERRAAVHDRARRGQRLPPVQVTERDVVRARGERAGRHVVLEDRLRGPLAAAERPPVTVRCAITTLTASAVKPAARLARTSRTISS